MPPASVNRGWFWAAVALTALKLWLTSGQTVYAIGPAFHDDKLFAGLAAHLINGDWLGPYDQFTLAKGPMFPAFLAGVFWLGLPLLLVQQLFYAGACAVVTRVLAPWLRPAAAQFSLYTLLLWNPMSYDAGNLSRLMRQNIYTPLALLVIAGLVLFFSRRREPWRRQAGPVILAGLALGSFWLTREESVWLLPAVGLLLLGLAASLGREFPARWRGLAVSLGLFVLAALLPILTVSALNLRHYGWFGTVEFRAGGFKAAYGALTRLKTGPELPQVPVTRQMRELAYEISPAFAQLRPHLEGEVGDRWIERGLFPAAERQIRGGWFIWAMRDAVVAAGLAPDAGTALRHYQRIADEVNAACDSGRVPARPPRSGFVPPIGRESLRPLLAGAAEFGGYFIFFRGFTARSPDSEGDYADLKPFRDLVGTRLSHAPRSPDPVPPTQGALEQAKVEWLERIGVNTGRVLAWLGPFVFLLGLARVVESLFARRGTFLLGLAAALLAACGAYLAINILVHVTSFYNLSPAAMAAAYPLYLLALFVLGTDAVIAWSRTTAARAERSGGTAAPSRWLWLVPAGAALAVFAARLREIHLYAGDVPYNDQWIIEAQQILAPWLNGTLRPWTFFLPHFEHLPVWTRLLAWLQVAITGRWDPLVQMTVNAGLHTGFVWLVARWLWRTLPARPAGLVTLVLVLGGALPHAWENIAWGFQSQFPLALIFLFLHVHGACTHPPGGRAWWLAQGAGVAGLFTLAGMWLAPLAVVVSQLWIGLRDRRGLLAPALITAFGLGLLAVIHWQAPPGHTFAQAGRTPIEFLHSVLHLLGWPSGLPGAVAVVQLPWLVHALRLRRQPGATALDRIILTLGCWNGAQAAGLAFARTGDTGDYVSRYGDLFFIGVFAGALALTRLVPAAGRARALFLAGGLLWGVVVTTGLFARATEGHARYFHQTSAQSVQLRRAAVQAYLQHGDRTLLEKNETRWVLTQSTGVLTELLDQPAFRALLPASVNPATPDYALGAFNRRLQSGWPGLLLGGLALLGLSLFLARWRGSPVGPPPLLAAAPDPWPARIALATGLVCTAGMFIWSNPLAFNREFRWRQLLGGGQAVTGLNFHFATPSPFGPERLQGAAPLEPVELRNQFYGTAPAGPGLTGTVLSSPFVFSHPWLVVPYAGYPVGDGNGLRLQVLDEAGLDVVTEIGCPGPNLDGIGYWSVEAGPHLGRKVRLVLYDGRTDTEAWVAAAPPIPTDNPELATSLGQRLENERHAGMHASLGVIALVAFACCFVAWPRRPAPPRIDPGK
jgi:hypothetical protein